MKLSEKQVSGLKSLFNEYSQVELVYDNDDFLVDDYVAGNVDNAFWKGFEQGNASLIREIRKIVNI